MSRRDGIDIKAIIDECKNYKDNISKLKKKSEPLEEQIKEYAVKKGLESIKSDNWQANISIKPNQDFNDLGAIEFLRENLLKSDFDRVVKTKEYIDDDELENLMYNGIIDAKDLAPFTIQKEPTVRLTIGKIK